ncbi:MAG: LamG domain-containing protein [Polyangiales bacterium]
MYRFQLDGSLADTGPAALSLKTGKGTFVADRHGTAGHAAGAGSCLVFSSFTNAGSTGAFSFSAWVRPQASFDLGSRQMFNSTYAGFFAFYRTAGVWTMEVYRGVGDVFFLSTTTPAPTGAWTHIAFTYDVAKGAAFYVGGVATTTTGSGPNSMLTTTTDLSLGCDGSGNLFSGDFDEVTVWSRSLAPWEIAMIAGE